MMKRLEIKKTLLWENVVFTGSNDLFIYLPFTKTTGFKGRILDVFEIKDADYCPVKALADLKKLSEKYQMFASKNPVFMLKSGKLLTVCGMNKILSSLLGDFIDVKFGISCHSFRAAIPSLMSENPETFSLEAIKQWGNWSSESYKRYTRSDKDKFRALFGKIMRIMNQ